MSKFKSKILKLLRDTPPYKALKKFVPSSWKKGAFNFEGVFPVKTKDGVNFMLYNNSFHLETMIFVQGIDEFDWERETRKVWNHLSKSSNIIFDVGANTGIFAVLARAYNNNATVVAFEPQPNIFDILKNNSKANGDSIICENRALSDESGSLPFYNYGNDAFTGNSTAGSLNKEWRNDNTQQSINVTVDTLEDYLIENPVGKIDLMKIDVETLEYQVLLGYGKALFEHEPLLILEIIVPDIGDKIASLFPVKDTLFFFIDEKAGLKEVKQLGREQGGGNYLICPAAKKDLLAALL